MMPVKLFDHAVAVSDCSRKLDRIRGNPCFRVSLFVLTGRRVDQMSLTEDAVHTYKFEILQKFILISSKCLYLQGTSSL